MIGDAQRIRLLMELRGGGVHDEHVLSAIERTPRELFMPETFADQAWENVALPIGQGQTISQPLVVALMTQALDVGPRHIVLEVGTGSGYQAAVLSLLCRRLFTIERHRPLLNTAEALFRDLRLSNITTRFADGSRGWKEQAPFDRIIVTACAPNVPASLVNQLDMAGVMVVPVAQGQSQAVVRVVREADRITETALFDVRFVPLVAGLAPQV